jgi:hypothetical protein
MMPEPRITYRYSRLTFHRDSIEPLGPDDIFRVETPVGAFEMSKADFYSTFPRVPLSRAYRDNGYYNFKDVPRRAMGFLVAGGTPGQAAVVQVGQYTLPETLRGLCSEANYRKWLDRKAVAHYNRDRKRWSSTGSVRDYKAAIHIAVIDAGKYDCYTGEELDWSLISKYDNEKSKAGKTSYKKTLAMLPTVDHAGAVPGDLNLRICSWRTNDAKSDLTLEEFIDLCAKVISHNRRSANPAIQPTRYTRG